MKLLLLTLGIFLITTYQLWVVAVSTGNWKGLYFSVAHMVIVAFGALYALMSTSTNSGE